MTKDEIGRILKEARTDAELTQQRVAELINRPQQTVAGWETGRSQPDADTLFRLFDIYGKSVDETFGLNRKAGILLSIHESKIIDQYRALDDYGQKAIDGLLDIEYTRCTAPAPLPDAVGEDQEPLYNVVTFPHPDNRVSAGFGDDFLNDDNMTMITAIANRDTIRADFCIEVDGHSMEPLYHDGDLVLVHKQPAIDVGAIGIFAANDKAYIKQQGEDRLVSLNPDYPDVKPEECYEYKCFGEVIGILDPEWIIE